MTVRISQDQIRIGATLTKTAVSQLFRRPLNRKVAMGGHSKMAQNSAGRRFMVHGPMTHARFRSRQRWSFEPELNFGLSGDLPIAGVNNGVEYPGILNRLIGPVDSKYGPVPQDVLRTFGAGVIVLQAFTNYWNLSTATATEAIQIATMMQKAVLDSGALLIWITDDPRGDAVATNGTFMRLSASNLQSALQLRRWMLAQRATPGVFVIDSWEALANPGSAFGDILTGYTYDSGLHLNQKGARRLGRLISRTLDPLYEPVTVLPASNAERVGPLNPSGALNANPYFVGTGGALNGHSGQIADGWASVPTNNGITFSFAKVSGATGFNGQVYPDQELKDWQQVTVGGTATNNNEIVVLGQTINTNLAVGDVLRAVAELEIDSIVNVSSLSLAIYDSTNTAILAEDFSNTTDIQTQPMENTPIDGIMLTPTTMPLSTAVARFHIRLRAASAAPVSCVFRVRGASIFKVLP